MTVTQHRWSGHGAGTSCCHTEPLDGALPGGVRCTKDTPGAHLCYFPQQSLSCAQPPPRAENLGHVASQPFPVPPQGAECWSFHPHTALVPSPGHGCQQGTEQPSPCAGGSAHITCAQLSEAVVELEDVWGCKMEQNCYLALL